MGAELLSSRDVIGRYFLALEQNPFPSWVDGISMPFMSDKASEKYAWLGQSPAMREFIGGLQAKGFTEYDLEIFNKEFEATLEPTNKDLRRDKTGQLMIRINELAQRTNSHWPSLLSALILTAESGLAYDGQYFFDTDHLSGKSGTQSNKLSIDISALPTSVHGSITYPSIGEMANCIMQAISQIVGQLDDQGEPLNEMAQKFLVMVPISLMSVAQSATTQKIIGNHEGNIAASQDDFEIKVAGNARLKSLTERFSVWRTDGQIKPLIRQEEVPPEMAALVKGSEHEIKNKRQLYTVYASRNVGFGRWEQACEVIMI